jgi:hypothetical protein
LDFAQDAQEENQLEDLGVASFSSRQKNPLEYWRTPIQHIAVFLARSFLARSI